MVNVEELKQRFKVANVPGLGQCIIIPEEKFDSAWDDELLQLGYECHGREDHIYVVLGPEARESKPKNVPGRRWTEKEDQQLIKLWNDQSIVHEISLPKRTPAAIKNRLTRLKKAGKIRSRYGPQQKVPAREKRKPEPFKFPKEIAEILTILSDQTKVLDKLSCQLLMQALEIKELKGELTIPPNLLVHYANALLEDDKTFRDSFRNKVASLLEASK